jgi:hypothetical protein
MLLGVDDVADEPVQRGGPPRRLRELDRRVARRAVVGTLIRAIGGAVAVLVLYYALPFASESTAGIVFRVVVATVAVAAMMFWQVNAILHAELPQLRAVDALVVSVSLMVVLFAATYESLSLRDPGSFTEVLDRTDALYFTLTTLTTVGYGDITAVTENARIIVMIQMVFNVAVIGVSVKLILGTVRHRLSVADADEGRPA